MSILLEHRSPQQLRGFVDGTLDLRDTWITRMHCIQCKSCANSVLELFLGKKILERALDEGKFSAHITREKLVVYVSDKLELDEQEDIAIHCSLCEDCEKLFESVADELDPPKKSK